MHRGTFITLEGIEGCGKTTQMNLLADYLRSKKIDVLITREPGGTKIGDEIRKILLNPEAKGMDYRAEVLLYIASRAQHVSEVIAPALEEGKFVLCDRYVDSTLAYQGFGRGLPLNKLIDINRWATQDINPHLTIFLYYPTEDGLKRATIKESDRMEQESIEFHRRVQDGFLKLAQLYSERYRIVDATGKKEEVHERIVKVLDEFL
ncbi:dTMP kinase [Candidatus Oleimmundimicrobium sp.]|uniref:dTMP kinase n=1 Tax=Candidatus Oleimmundimicrobium sp. TaxID=3060597 RepID=UPI00271B8885|nr:dTMP kinase [Candidatus Oleimmundimicrobium sp.]MDO8886423.1 dTMP kinase [Candidatus Oleimmundimicrobium sp.]